MAPPRSAKLQVSRPVLFRPFTSVITEDLSTKTPAFEFVIPRDANDFIRLDLAKWPTTRFVYIFLGQSAAAAMETFALRLTVGPNTGPNPLLFVIRVDRQGKQKACTGLEFKNALAQDTQPPFVDVNKFEFIAIEPEMLLKETPDTYAIAAPVLLPAATIGALEQARPELIPLLGTGMGIGVSGAAVSATPADPDWVFPVVDPIIIAEHLTKKFYEACDDFLATSQVFERPKPRNETEKSARQDGEVLRLKKTIADNLIALKKAAPQLEGTFNSNLEAGFPESFLNEYNATLDRLSRDREIAAFALIAWLETDLFELADSFWERKQGKPNPDYEIYVKAVLEGLLRLVEADRGVAYLMDVRNRVEQGSSPVPSGVLHVSTEFIFRETQSSDEQRVVVQKLAIQVFGAWSAFVAAVLAVQQIVITGPNPQSSLVDDLETFAKRLRAVFRENVLRVDTADVQVEFVAKRGAKAIIAPMRAPELTGVESVLAKANLPTPHVTRLLAVLNVGIAFTALRKELEEKNGPNAKVMAIADLSGAGLGIADQVSQAAFVTRFRDRLSGKVNMGGSLLGNRVSSTLGLLGAVTSLISASLATADSYDKGDWDQALSHMTEGVGAVLVGVGSTVILVSGATGPFALWTIGIGTAIGAAGFIWSIFAADTEIEQMLKFCAFGTLTSAGSPPGWSLCKSNFSEWNKNTPAGLLLQLKAFQQLFFAFSASGTDATPIGPLASDGFLRITPATLRQNCSFLVDYAAEYSQFGSDDIVQKLNGRITLLVRTTPNPVFIDAGNNYEPGGAIRVHKDEGRDAMDIQFRLKPSLAPSSGLPLELRTLTCNVSLQIPNANVDDPSAPLIVPTTSKGPTSVKVIAVEERAVKTDPQQSVKVK
jgi:hypothetical protein